MPKQELLSKLRESSNNKNFHLISVMVSSTAEDERIRDAKELEKDGAITLEICQKCEIDGAMGVELKGIIL